MPLSFQGFGFTALLIMLAVLSASHLVRFVRGKVLHSKHRTVDKVDG